MLVTKNAINKIKTDLADNVGEKVKFASKKGRKKTIVKSGVIEGAYVPNKRFAAAVQWHPELMFKTDKNAMALFKVLVEAAKE